MGKKIKTIFGILVLIGGLILIFKDILDLWNTKDLHTVKADYAVEVLEVSHRIDIIIPAGKEHYFLALAENENGVEGYIVRADGKWHSENFNDKNLAKTEDGVEITALSKDLRNKYQSLIETKIKKLEDVLEVPIHFSHARSTYLDMGYRWRAILKLVTLVLILLEIIAGVVFTKCSVQSRPVLTGYLIAVILTVFAFLTCILVSL